MTTLLKFVHLASIALWSGGLLILPFLFWQRRGLDGLELDRLHRFVRFIFVGVASPSAFIAIGSGTALIFLQTTFLEWFSLKMVLVGMMAMLHVVAALIMAHLFDPGGTIRRGLCIALGLAYLTLITAIIWVVLAKPHIDLNTFAEHIFTPGALGQFFGDTRMPMP